MTNAAALDTIENLRAHREKLVEFCRSLTEEQLERPVPGSAWRVKDFIAHLATFDAEFLRWLQAAKEGVTDAAAKNPDGSRYDIDKWNNARVAERRAWPLERLLEEAAENRRRLVEALRELGDEDVAQVWQFAGDSKRPAASVPLSLFLHGVTRHDPIHVADMLKALPELADDPGLRAWIDDNVVNWYQRVMSGTGK